MNKRLSQLISIYCALLTWMYLPVYFALLWLPMPPRDPDPRDVLTDGYIFVGALIVLSMMVLTFIAGTIIHIFSPRKWWEDCKNGYWNWPEMSKEVLKSPLGFMFLPGPVVLLGHTIYLAANWLFT